jgi:error-prone DNA polymerase
VVFLSLEDETGMVNVICPPHVWERHRRVAVAAPALVVGGRIERTGAAGRAGGAGGAPNLLAAILRPLRVAASRTGAAASRDFR